MAKQGQEVGYVRVSTVEQSTARQLDGVALDATFEDKASGRDRNRPQLQALVRHVRAGDTVHCHSMDRLARNVDDLRKMIGELTGRGVQIRFHREGLLFTGQDSPMSNLLLTLLGAVSQFERELLRERQAEGIAIAKRAGVYRGRKPSLTADQVSQLRQRVAQGEKKASLARELRISRETLYSYLNSSPQV